MRRRAQGQAHRRHDDHLGESSQDAEEPGLYTGGQILDPAKGSSYKLRLKPIEGGKKLEVRGYIGSPMFGRTQTWVRVE